MDLNIINEIENDEKKYSMNEIIVLGTQIGVQAGMEYIKKEKEKRRQSRYDRRLRNTKLLLREFRKLCIHCKESVEKVNLNVIDVLDELDSFEYSDDLYIESIKKSKERTAAIVEHVKKMMGIYRYISNKSRKPEELRRFNVIYKMYISPTEATIEELAAEFIVNKRTIYKDVDIATETLASLIFGIDGLKVY